MDLATHLDSLRPEIVKAAQEAIDGWSIDELGDGGICDEVSQAIAGVIALNIEDVEIEDGGHEGDDHAWVIATLGDETYGIDIPHHLYETGGGYSWKKIEGVIIEPDDVEIWPI